MSFLGIGKKRPETVDEGLARIDRQQKADAARQAKLDAKSQAKVEKIAKQQAQQKEIKDRWQSEGQQSFYSKPGDPDNILYSDSGPGLSSSEK